MGVLVQHPGWAPHQGPRLEGSKTLLPGHFQSQLEKKLVTSAAFFGIIFLPCNTSPLLCSCRREKAHE